MKRWIPVVMLAVLPIMIDAQSATPPSQAPAKAPAPLPDMSLKARFLSQYQYVRGNLVKMAEKMPGELLEAHQFLDAAVDQLYRKRPFQSDDERLELLFDMYESAISGKAEPSAALETAGA